jgi:hypothetical protein
MTPQDAIWHLQPTFFLARRLLSSPDHQMMPNPLVWPVWLVQAGFSERIIINGLVLMGKTTFGATWTLHFNGFPQG